MSSITSTRFAHRPLVISSLKPLAAFVLSFSAGASLAAQLDEAEQQTAANPNAPAIEEIYVEGDHLTTKTGSRMLLMPRELPQSVSVLSRELMDLNTIQNLNDLMMNVTGVNVTLYDSQRPLYFARGFQITDFQVDGIPTYSGSTNQEYDTAFYQSVEVVRGANGLISGIGEPSATVNLIRKRPKKELDAAITATAGSWNFGRLEADVSVPLNSDGSLRSRFVAVYQDSDSFRDRYEEEKIALYGIVEADLSDKTTLAFGYQSQDNNPTGTIWGTVPIFAADGDEAFMPVSTSFAPDWTKWQRETNTLFADINHQFNEDWSLTAAFNRTKGEMFSLRAYATGFPNRATGSGMKILAGIGESEDTRDGLDIAITGSFNAFGRNHDLRFGANAATIERHSPTFSRDTSWSYDIPNAWAYNGEGPMMDYAKTGAYSESTTKMHGVYGASRFRVTDAFSVVAGARVTSWETGTDGFDTSGNYTATTGDYKVSSELSSYAGLIYELNKTYTLYTSFTDIFDPQNKRDRNNELLSPVSGTNIEAGIKGSFLNEQLNASLALFKTEQDNFGVVDQEWKNAGNTLPDGGDASRPVDSTASKGVELNLEGYIHERWTINTGYTYVKTNRHENDKIWTNLPEHSAQLSTHYTFADALENLTLGGGFNWQSETTGYELNHPTQGSVTYEQGSYLLANLYSTWKFNDNFDVTLKATNLFDKTYWANIDYANYGEPRNVKLSLSWKL